MNFLFITPAMYQKIISDKLLFAVELRKSSDKQTLKFSRHLFEVFLFLFDKICRHTQIAKTPSLD